MFDTKLVDYSSGTDFLFKIVSQIILSGKWTIYVTCYVCELSNWCQYFGWLISLELFDNYQETFDCTEFIFGVSLSVSLVFTSVDRWHSFKFAANIFERRILTIGIWKYLMNNSLESITNR